MAGRTGSWCVRSAKFTTHFPKVFLHHIANCRFNMPISPPGSRTGCAAAVSRTNSQLGNELPALELPTDFPRNKNRGSFGAVESLLLPRPLTRAIRTLGQREDMT